jgi:uncharacterized protein (UPF0548 family)
MFFARRPSARKLVALLADASERSPTYAEVGASSGAAFPSGYRHDTDELVVGRGREAFERSVAAVRGWQAQLGAGVEVVPEGTAVSEGQTVLLLIRALGLWTVAPCRVVYAVEEADSYRFAYATLPGHPEQGEASFAVTQKTHDDVVFRVASFSRPADPFARAAKPLSRRLQRQVTLRYLTAIENAVAQP